MAVIPGHRVIVFLQENKTTDFYFPSLAAWGAFVANHGNLLAAAPNFDQPHDRNAWVHYAMGDYPALPVQLDNDRIIPFYSYLAKEFTFSDHHFGSGSNSTPGHMLAIGGQMPTMKNPPFFGPHPVWDLPSIFTSAEAGHVSWAAFPDQSGYPTKFYTSLTTAPGSANVYPPKDFIPMAKAGTLPDVCYVWGPSGYDEHPPHVSDPSYITKGQNLVWERVQAVIDGGGWANTTFILSWDDWGGYADSLPTPAIETVPDALHPNGYAAIGGSRIPLIMFGGKVTPTHRSRMALPRVYPQNHHRSPRTPADGSPPRRYRAHTRQPRKRVPEPHPATRAGVNDHTADAAQPATNPRRPDTVGGDTRAADARTNNPRWVGPARAHRRSGTPNPTQAAQEQVTATSPHSQPYSHRSTGSGPPDASSSFYSGDRYRPAWPVTRRVGPEAALGARCVLIAVGDPDRTASDTFPEVFPA